METAEDYVEAIAAISDSQGYCRIVDLSRHFAVSHVTVSRIIARLESQGLVRTEAYRPMRLTALGSSMATAAKKRHETVFDFLLAIGVDAKTASLDAEGIEHHVSPKTLGCMRSFVKGKS
jgi:DtxR family manganese transport transcriptional regulator